MSWRRKQSFTGWDGRERMDAFRPGRQVEVIPTLKGFRSPIKWLTGEYFFYAPGCCARNTTGGVVVKTREAA